MNVPVGVPKTPKAAKSAICFWPNDPEMSVYATVAPAAVALADGDATTADSRADASAEAIGDPDASAVLLEFAERVHALSVTHRETKAATAAQYLYTVSAWFVRRRCVTLLYGSYMLCICPIAFK